MIRINLVAEGKRPVVARPTRGPAPSLAAQDIGQWLAVVGILVGIVIFGAHWFLLNTTIKGKQREIDVAQQEVNDLQAIIDEVNEFKRKKEELEHKIKVINELKLNQRGPVEIMDQISRALPELLWLDRMDMTASNITVNGRAFNTNAIANFIENLDRVPEFQEPFLRDSARRGPVYNFVITFNFRFRPLSGVDTESVSEAAGG